MTQTHDSTQQAPGEPRTGRRAVWVALLPRDTMLVRDGRAFDAGADLTAETVRPWPSTVAGALGAAYGRELDEVRGPVLGRRLGDQAWTLYFPWPQDIVKVEGAPRRTIRLRPEPAATVSDLPGAAPRWLTAAGQRGKTPPAGGWLPGARLGAYLRGELFGRPGGESFDDLRRQAVDPLAPERRVGLARTPARTARTGLLYRATHLRLRDGWAFLVQCVLPAGWGAAVASPVPLGGRTRLADVQPASGMDWPEAPRSYPGGRVLVYVATPALWPGGWRIPEPPGASLVAAAVGEPEPVATASPGARFWQTRRLRWAVPAGSVYLLQFDDADGEDGAERAGRWAAATHGTACGPAVDERLRTAGFGVVLTGVWS
jgi:CRISPR-associated protein Cmr3